MKSKFIILGLTASVPIVLFFQNCSQAGQLNVSNGSTAAALNTSVSSTDSLVIDPASSGDSSSASQTKPQPDIHISEPALTSDDLIGSNASEQTEISRCGRVEISDLLLQINSVSSGTSCEAEKDQSFVVIDSDKSVSLNKLNLKIKAVKNSKIKEIFLGLSSDGNKILTADNLAMNLNTPSGQTAGIKVDLASEISVEANQVYSLDLVINPAEQLVSNPHRCIFKPIIQEASLSISQ